jgi:hypothetical protein
VVRRRLLRLALLSGQWGDRGNAPATNTGDLGMEMIAEQGMPLRNTMLLLYSPECVEGEFLELRARLHPETLLFNDARGSAR